MGVDPTIVQSVAERMRAEVLPKAAPALRLDQSIIEKIAQRVPIFAGMSRADMVAVLATGEHFSVDPGQPVFREGDIGNSFYVLITGDVVVEKLRDGRPVELKRLGPGECFGEMALVGNDLRSATVRALGDVVVAMRFYRELIDSNPEGAAAIYRNIARILASRLGESSVLLAELKKSG